MNIIISILSLLVCLIGLSLHSSVRNYAEINVPNYMKSMFGMLMFLAINIAIIFINAFVLINLRWYWVLLITILSTPILYLVSMILFEGITKANFTYVTGCTSGQIWRKTIFALILAIVAASI